MRARSLASRLHGRTVFVLAPPGSAAEAVASAITSLPGVRSSGLGPMFSDAIPSLVGNFVVGEGVGLSAVWDERDFLVASRSLVDDLLDPDRTGSVVVHTAPGEAEWVEVIALLYPDARFVHVVRAAAEVASAAPGPAEAMRNARRWRNAHRRIAEAERRPRFPELAPAHLPRLVVALDDLREDPVGQVGRLAAGLPLDLDDDDVARAGAVLAASLPPGRVTVIGRVASLVARALR